MAYRTCLSSRSEGSLRYNRRCSTRQQRLSKPRPCRLRSHGFFIVHSTFCSSPARLPSHTFAKISQLQRWNFRRMQSLNWTGRNCGRWLGGESRDALSGTRQRMALLKRKGQRGNVYQPQYLERWNPQAPAHGRFWIDVQGGERKRKTVSLGRCATEWAARLRLREYIERAGVNTRNAFGQVPVPGTTFRQQAESWIESVSIRKRRPAKPATI
jgi:hypothetical protein